MQRCVASGAREPEAEAAGQNPNGTKGRKISEKILGTSRVKVLENCGTSKSSLDLRNIVVLRCPGDIELVQKNCFLWCSIEAVSAMFAINMDLDKLKHTPSLEMPKIGTPQNLKTIPFSVRVSCHRPNSHMNWRNIGSNYEDLHIMIISSCGCVHATSERTLRKLRIAL